MLRNFCTLSKDSRYSERQKIKILILFFLFLFPNEWKDSILLTNKSEHKRYERIIRIFPVKFEPFYKKFLSKQHKQFL